MISKILGALSLIKEIWEAIKTLLAMLKRAEHEKKIGEISEGEKQAGDPSSSLEDRLKGGAKLEENINRNA